MTRPLDAAREYWDRHAIRDPLWAVLSDGSRTDRRWDLPAFMETGEREISLLLHEIRALDLDVAPRAAVDFGCGVGRLTQALARRFETVVGLDVSPEMIRLARQVNKYGPRVRYETNDGPLRDTLPEASADFVYSNLVLQHVPPDLSRGYLADLVRSLRPGGVLVFQFPSTRAEATPSPVAMPESAYQASISAGRTMPAQLEAGSTLAIPVIVLNCSGSMWSQEHVGAIRAGNHWLNAQAGMVVQDDGRRDLPAELQPGERSRVELHVRAPVDPGQYLLELDLVHEGVTWFGDRGSRTVRIPIEVLPAEGQHEAPLSTSMPPLLAMPDYSDVNLPALLQPSDDDAPVSAFPMHGLPRETVAAIVTGAGARIVHVVDDDHAKPEWNGHKYFVMKNSATC